MAEYINQEVAMREIAHSSTLNSAYLRVATIPAADVVEVRHGRWVEECVVDFNKAFCSIFFCSNCGKKYRIPKMNYCPNCGSRMDGE